MPRDSIFHSPTGFRPACGSRDKQLFVDRAIELSSHEYSIYFHFQSHSCELVSIRKYLRRRWTTTRRARDDVLRGTLNPAADYNTRRVFNSRAIRPRIAELNSAQKNKIAILRYYPARGSIFRKARGESSQWNSQWRINEESAKNGAKDEMKRRACRASFPVRSRDLATGFLRIGESAK